MYELGPPTGGHIPVPTKTDPSYGQIANSDAGRISLFRLRLRVKRPDRNARLHVTLRHVH